MNFFPCVPALKPTDDKTIATDVNRRHTEKDSPTAIPFPPHMPRYSTITL